MLKQLAAAAALVLWGFTSAAGAADETPEGVRKALQVAVPGVEIQAVTTAPIAGLYEVVVGPQIYYVSADGKYLIRGDIVDLASKDNLTDEPRRSARLRAIEDLGEANMIVFSPDKPRHTISVFTDVDCGYCQKLHREVQTLNEQGVKVRYLAFPRGGFPSANYDKTVSVWCSDDRRKAMTDAKFGAEVPAKECDNPVKDQYTMGRLVGVTGTPTIILESGDIVPGYVPADRLVRMLDGGAGG